MLINLSNHPTSNWSEEQTRAAIEQFDEIMDLPFPHIDPDADSESIVELAEQYRDKCLEIFEANGYKPYNKRYAVHIMGEMNFTYNVVLFLNNKAVNTVASTTYRDVEEDGNGVKISVFRFSRFRCYHPEFELPF